MLNATSDDRAMIWLVRGLIGALLVGAAVAKAVAPTLALRLLVGVFHLPMPVAWVAVIAGVCVEAGIGLSVWAAPRSALPARAAIWLLVVFSGALAVLRVTNPGVGCGCFGGAFAGRWDVELGLLRNMAACIMLVWLLARMKGPRLQDTCVGSVPAGGGAVRGGFTLIEVLVCIAVIGILVALAVPSIARARHAGKEARSLSTERQLLLGLSGYTRENAGAFPFLAKPGDPFSPAIIRGFAIPTYRSQGFFRDQSWYWVSLISASYIDMPRAQVEPAGLEEFFRRKGFPEDVIGTTYLLSYTVFARQAYFGGVALDPVPQFIGCREADVQFPSQKGLILDAALGAMNSHDSIGRDMSYVGLADGSARSRRWSDFDQKLVVQPVLVPNWSPVLSTKYGLAGKDF